MAGRRFGPDFVAERHRKVGKYPPEQRQLTYDIAVNDDCAPWRQWLDDQLALLPAHAADAMARRIWLDEHFWPVNFELATGAGLRGAGLSVTYEQDWDGVTPDWTILSEANKPLAFVEVHTDQPPSGTFSQIRAWHGLVERVKAIPVPVVLQLASKGGPVSPPDAGTAKRIAKDLHTKLLQQPLANMFLSHGYRFLVMGDRRRGGQQMVSPLGMHALFEPPSSRAGPVTAQRLMERIGEKVHNYRRLAETYEVPLMVAVGAHRFTGDGGPVCVAESDGASFRAFRPSTAAPAATMNAANNLGARSSQARATIRMASNASNPAASNSAIVALLGTRAVMRFSSAISVT